MQTENRLPLILREATADDIPALLAIRSEGGEAHYRGRLRDAESPDFRYLVLVRDQEVIGFVCLVFRRPPSWGNVDDVKHLPQIIDLYVADSQQGQGYGTAAIHLLERMAFERGAQHIYISVEPIANPRAYALYQRLGYQRIQIEPYFYHWIFVSDDGTIEEGKEWLVDMVKPLPLADDVTG